MNHTDKKIEALEVRGIPYQLVETKSLKVSIGVSKDAICKIRYHKSVSHEWLNDYVLRHIEWIEKTFIKYYRPKREFKNNERYLFLGKEYILNILKTNTNEIIVEGKYLTIHTRNLETLYIKKLINKWLLEQAYLTFEVILNQCFLKMEKYLNKYPKLEIKRYKSRWGCCYPKDNKIILNLSLIHTSLELIEYVVFHELCHFVYKNHQSEFHNLLRKFVPNEMKLKKILNNYSTNYE